ncbi:helix-turn-helix transcriptional regulator [Vagococcus sp. BWB3-3]|uniref:Helix-turn-helix transcriptional regulator n=1 Tax=Vagococcus allomyrinae TaxID=2794353 RepID=A0A940PBD1_9ENTE|nr:helix-turn-helix transcriptional regulator [Vagococcus allomyrinae]MBP1041635.1 helix-turn-helix transcriptional regulator [Vagococcus allomyrinae]
MVDNQKQHNVLVSKRIQELVNQEKITPNRLATLADLTPSTLNSIYTGKSKNPTIKTITNICDALDISVREFFDFPPYNLRPSQTEESPEELMRYLKQLSREIQQIEKKIQKKTS